jgi:hypothetical protein
VLAGGGTSAAVGTVGASSGWWRLRQKNTTPAIAAPIAAIFAIARPLPTGHLLVGAVGPAGHCVRWRRPRQDADVHERDEDVHPDEPEGGVGGWLLWVFVGTLLLFALAVAAVVIIALG